MITKMNMQKMRNVKSVLFAILLVAAIFWGGCTKPDSTLNKTATAKSFTLEIKDMSGKIIARGELQLPANTAESVQFTDSCKINGFL